MHRHKGGHESTEEHSFCREQCINGSCTVDRGGLGSNDRAGNVGTYSFCSCLSYYIFLYCLSTLAL